MSAEQRMYGVETIPKETLDELMLTNNIITANNHISKNLDINVKIFNTCKSHIIQMGYVNSIRTIPIQRTTLEEFSKFDEGLVILETVPNPIVVEERGERRYDGTRFIRTGAQTYMARFYPIEDLTDGILTNGRYFSISNKPHKNLTKFSTLDNLRPDISGFKRPIVIDNSSTSVDYYRSNLGLEEVVPTIKNPDKSEGLYLEDIDGTLSFICKLSDISKNGVFSTIREVRELPTNEEMVTLVLDHGKINMTKEIHDLDRIKREHELDIARQKNELAIQKLEAELEMMVKKHDLELKQSNDSHIEKVKQLKKENKHKLMLANKEADNKLEQSKRESQLKLDQSKRESQLKLDQSKKENQLKLDQISSKHCQDMLQLEERFNKTLDDLERQLEAEIARKEKLLASDITNKNKLLASEITNKNKQVNSDIINKNIQVEYDIENKRKQADVDIALKEKFNKYNMDLKYFEADYKKDMFYLEMDQKEEIYEMESDSRKSKFGYGVANAMMNFTSGLL